MYMFSGVLVKKNVFCHFNITVIVLCYVLLYIMSLLRLIFAVWVCCLVASSGVIVAV